jgi:transposase InsO family protein
MTAVMSGPCCGSISATRNRYVWDLRTSLIVEALAAALMTRKPPHGVIFHGDRGCQYTSREFADFCAANGIVRSMGRRATLDNALMESTIGL